MKHVTHLDAQLHQNSQSCKVLEYGNIETIDGADIEIKGRYPEANFALNKKSDLVVRVLSGTGRLAVRNKEMLLNIGDVAFVGKDEPYFFEGHDLKMFMVCTPAWNVGQYSEVKL